MAIEILMPKLGLTMKTGTVVKWLKSEGDVVHAKEPVLEIETEKLSYQIESPADGILIKKIAVVGEKYPITFVVGYIGKPGEQVPEKNVTAAPLSAPVTAELANAATANVFGSEAKDRVFISPVAKKLAAELNLNYKEIKGSGPNGRIIKSDVLKYDAVKCSAPLVTYSKQSDENDTVIPYSGIRRAIGNNTLQAWSTIPMVTHHVTTDVGALLEYRAMLNQNVEKSDQVSINDLLLKLTAAALIKMPIINSSLTDEGIVVCHTVHLGMATALDNGLIVPVIRNANKKNLLAISAEAKDLAARARSGNLIPDETHGATFTISNLGSYGSVDLFTPIINPPQAGILGIGRITEAAVPVNGEIKIRPLMGLSFTYDHRIIDGAVAAKFIQILIQLLNSPARSVLL